MDVRKDSIIVLTLVKNKVICAFSSETSTGFILSDVHAAVLKAVSTCKLKRFTVLKRPPEITETNSPQWNESGELSETRFLSTHLCNSGAALRCNVVTTNMLFLVPQHEQLGSPTSDLDQTESMCGSVRLKHTHSSCSRSQSLQCSRLTWGTCSMSRRKICWLRETEVERW